MSLTILDQRAATGREWQDAWVKCEYATPFQSPLWMSIWKEFGGQDWDAEAKRILISDGSIITIPYCTVSIFRGLSRQALLSPAGTYGGWLCDTPLTTFQQSLVIRTIKSIAPAVSWTTNPYHPLNDSIHSAGITNTALQTHVLDLEQGFHRLEDMWRACGILQKTRAAVRANVSIEKAANIDDWKDYYSIYLESIKRWGVSARGTLPWGLFEILQSKNSSDITLWVARKDRIIVAGAICVYSKHHAIYWHGATLESAMVVRASNLLFYEIIKDAASSNRSWFDFNPSPGLDGVRKFKESFLAQPMNCTQYEKQSLPMQTLCKLNTTRRKIAAHFSFLQ